MKFGTKIIFLTLLLWSIWLCGGEVSFVVTADLHGRLDKLALLAPEIKRYPEAVKVDLGDFFQGNFEVISRNGMPVIEVFNDLNYDILIPGNHDLEHPVRGISGWHKLFRGKILTGQWELSGFATSAATVVTRGQYRIGVIALGDVGLKKRRRCWDELVYRDEVQTACQAADFLRGKCDALVLMGHISTGNYPVISAILKAVPEIVAVAGAHSHRHLPGGIIRNALVVQPGAYAESAVLLKLHFDDRTGKFTHAVSKLILPGKSADKKLLDNWEKLQEQCAAEGKTVLAEFRNVEQFGRICARIVRQAVGAQMAIVCFDPGRFQPLMNSRGLFRIFPYGNRITLVKADKMVVDKFLKKRKRKNEKFFVSGNAVDGVFTLAVSDYIFLREPLLRHLPGKITPFFERQTIESGFSTGKTGEIRAE